MIVMITIDEKLNKQIEDAKLVPIEFLLKDIPLHEQFMQSIRDESILTLKKR